MQQIEKELKPIKKTLYRAKDQDGDEYIFTEEPHIKEDGRGNKFWYCTDTTPSVRIYDASRDELTPVGRMFALMTDLDFKLEPLEMIFIESCFNIIGKF